MEIIDNNNVVVDVVVDYLMCECSFVSKFDIKKTKKTILYISWTAYSKEFNYFKDNSRGKVRPRNDAAKRTKHAIDEYLTTSQQEMKKQRNSGVSKENSFNDSGSIFTRNSRNVRGFPESTG